VLDEDVPVLPGHHEGYHHTLFALAGGFVLSLHGHAATDAGQRFDEFRPGLDHVGFGCADRGELERLQGRLEEPGIDHGGIAEDAVGYALSFRDPDGVALEFWAPLVGGPRPADRPRPRVLRVPGQLATGSSIRSTHWARQAGASNGSP
jgi:glyoxylase I family protein